MRAALQKKPVTQAAKEKIKAAKDAKKADIAAGLRQKTLTGNKWLYHQIATETGVSITNIDLVIKGLKIVVGKALKKGGTIIIYGFATFMVSTERRNGRLYAPPLTAPAVLPAFKKIKVRASKSWSRVVN